MNVFDPACCFDATAYTGVPDSAPCPVAGSVPDIVSRLDALLASGREAEAESYLEGWLAKMRSAGDWRGELAVLSELLGLYRRSMSEDKALSAVADSMALIRLHRMGFTVSGGTVLLNAATTLKCFSRAAESLPIFEHVLRVYGASLDPADYRFAGLYNNMALSYADIGDGPRAEKYFSMAIRVMETCPNGENELAVTMCNLARLYADSDPDDARIETCADRAWGYLNAPGLPRDGYHAFTALKCAEGLEYFGFFMYAKELRERAAAIYADT